MNAKLRYLEHEINKLPKFNLGYFPTPLQKCPNLEKALKVQNIYFKRDDLTGLAYGGNKVRHLEFRIGDILKNKYDIFINSDQKISNNSRINAAACIKAGIKYINVMSTSHKNDNQGNYLLQKLMNVEIHEIDSNNEEEIENYCIELSKKLILKGHKPYIRPKQEFIKHSSIIGYISGGLELLNQINKLNLQNIKIYQVAGNSVIGLSIFKKHCNLDWEINAISPYLYNSKKDMQKEGIKNGNNVAKLLNLNLKLDSSDINYDYNFVGKDYGISTKSSIQAIELLAKTESIFLDPVYTAKSMSGLIEHVNNNKFSPKDNIIFIHSGGTPNLFTYAKDLIKNKNK